MDSINKNEVEQIDSRIRILNIDNFNDDGKDNTFIQYPENSVFNTLEIVFAELNLLMKSRWL